MIYALYMQRRQLGRRSARFRSVSALARCSGFLLLTCLTLPAAAQDAPAASGEVKRDPSGIKGISPYNEDLAKGREASAKGDHGAAISHFDAAIAKADNKMLAFLLKSQAQVASGNLDAAIETATVGRGKEGTEEQQAKLMFLTADLDERKADTAYGSEDGTGGLKEALNTKWEQVKTVWKAYSAYVTEHTRVPNYQASADERNKKIDERVKRDADYGEVKLRIAKNAAGETK
jgi:hypothetical protein